ncbi:unnamed protein product [Rotaria sp. Silwood1]|nr:unnamed protein product [Rotaria sp. Silwood1]CAF1586573.1 unnamed protein product [Rotaria sp. Silwood1]CAF3619048.1 unnamed protein product [Rotaria sp. Silwood1]CAF3668003.1 unnamed protein product [Rotaria sp. Silwood1]CAF4777359.1 unnamed protein product [Rotaria sp. Silwood1]
MIIASHIDGDNRCRTGDNNGQFIMCIPGCGDTGKLQLIHALSKYFLITKRMQMTRKLAPTGIAAAEIGGMTNHSFLDEQRNSGKSRAIKSGDSKLEKEWRLVEYLLIHEMSMVGLNLLAKLNRIICSAKHVDPQVPFGGVNVLFFGDYLRYRPVYHASLHTDFSLQSKNTSSKLPNEKEIQQRVVRSLILQINCVAPIFVFRNEVGTQLNNKAVIRNAKEMGQRSMVCVAQDTYKGNPIEDSALIKKL